jgi:AraC-like DNA-binding protein
LTTCGHEQEDCLVVPIAEEPTVFSFSTDAFPERDRLSSWREVVCRTVVSVDMEPLKAGAFYSKATVCQLPGLGAVFVDTVAMHMNHSRELIRGDDLSFVAAPSCQWSGSQAGRNPVCRPGDGMLMNNAEVGSITLASDARFTSFSMPVAAIAPLVSDLDGAIARPISADNPALKLLVAYLENARDVQALVTPQLQRLAVTHVYDLVAMTLGATRDAGEIAKGRGVRAARLREARAFILRNLARGDLTAADVAAHLGVTPRYTHMLFEDEKESFSEFLLRERLMRAHRTLIDQRLAGRPISAIAFDAGFSDLSYFNRTFRRRFGMTPSQARGEQLRRR